MREKPKIRLPRSRSVFSTGCALPSPCSVFQRWLEFGGLSALDLGNLPKPSGVKQQDVFSWKRRTG